MKLIRISARSKAAAGVCLVVMALLIIGMGSAGGADEFTLKAENNKDGLVRLTWTFLENPEADRYEIFWEEEEFDSVAGLEPKAAERGNTYLVQGLEERVMYHFAVVAKDKNDTVLGEDFDSAQTTVPHLKEINYWNLMAVFMLTTVVFIFVLIKVPKWGVK